MDIKLARKILEDWIATGGITIRNCDDPTCPLCGPYIEVSAIEIKEPLQLEDKTWDGPGK